MARQFVINGTAVIKKVKLSQQARSALQNIAISVDTTQVQRSLSRLGTSIQQTIRPLRNLGRGSAGVNRLARSMGNVASATGRANTNLKKTDILLFQVLRKASAFRVSTIIINGFFNAFSEGLKFTIEFDAALRNINKILRTTDADLTAFGSSLIAVARDFNLAAEEVAKGARTAAQAGIAGQGASAQEQQVATLGLVRKAALLAATSTLEFEQALETLLAVSKQTDQSISGAAVTIAKFAAVEDAAAVDASALAEVFKRAGTTLSQNFGPNLNDAIGLISAVSERSRQSASVVGTFFKTLGARLSGANSEAVSGLKKLNISIEDSNGNLKNLSVLLGEIREATKGLGAQDLGEALGQIGGVRQAELFRIALESGGRAQELAAAASQGVATQTRKAAEESAKFETSLNRIKQTFNEIVNDLRNGPLSSVFKDLADGLEGIVSFFKNLDFSALGGLGAGILGGGVINQLTGGGLSSFGGNDNSKSERERLKRVSNLGKARQKILARNNSILRNNSSRMQVLGKGLRGVNKALPAFEAKTIALSVGIGFLAEKLRNLGKESDNKIVSKLGEVGGTFAQFLPFGPKIASLAVLVQETVGNFEKIITVSSALEGNLEANAKLLERGQNDIFKGNGGADPQGAASLRRRAQGEIFDNGINGGNDAQADLLAGKFAAIVEEAVRGIDTKDPASVDVAKKKIQEFILAGLEGAEFEQLSGLKNFAAFIDKLDGDLKDTFAIADADAFSTLSETILQTTIRLGEFRNATTQFSDGLAAISKTQLEQELKLITARQKASESIANVFNAEQELFNSRIDAGTATEISQAISLERELANTRIAAITEANRAIEQKEKRRLQRVLQGSQEKLALQLDLRDQNANDPGRGSGQKIGSLNKQFDELSVAIKKNQDVIAGTIRSLASGNIGATALAKVEKNLLEIRQLEVNLIQQELSSRSAANDARRTEIARNIQVSQSLTQSALTEANAREKLQSAIANKNDPVGDVDGEVANRKRVLEFRLAGIRSEISALQQLEATALEVRKAEQLDIIKRLESTRTGVASKDGDVDAGVGRAKKIIESIGSIQVNNGKRVQGLLVKQALLEGKIRVTAIDGLRRRLDAARKVEKERLAAAGKLLNVSKAIKESVASIFEAQKSLTDSIRTKLEEAANEIKSKRGALSTAFDGLASAREALIDGSRDAAGAFADFNTEVAKAAIAADKILGKFSGLRQQAGALNSALNETIDAAARAGASEEKLSELRKDAAEQQLSLFQKLLSDSQSKAESFFTSSGEDRQGFVQGLASIQQIAGQFGGNIDNFRGLDEGALNDLGRSLISLPQEVRQNIAGALGQLPDGVQVAGLNQDEIKEILQGASLGESEEVGIERLSDTIQTVADLTRQVADLNTSQLITSQRGLAELQAGVAEAREQVLISKNALSQAKLDAVRTQAAIRDVVATLNSQIGESRESFKNDAAQIAATIKDPAERQVKLLELMVEFQKQAAGKISNTAGLVGSVTPNSAIETTNTRLPGVINGPGTAGREITENISKGIEEANRELRAEITGLKTVLSGNFTDNIVRSIEATEKLASEFRASAASAVQDVKAELNIDNTQKINISGATEIVESVIRALETKDFVTQQDLTEIQKVLAKVIEDQINAGITRPNRALGG